MAYLVSGENGNRACKSVEVVIRKDPENVTALFLSLEDLVVRVPSLAANVVIWIHAIQHVQLKTCDNAGSDPNRRNLIFIQR